MTPLARAFGVAATPERPGPGPMPDALLRALELTIGRRVEGLLAGDHRSALLGRGSELAQVRPYVPGDDVRLIDWNVTARTGEPHVRVHLAERVLVTWIVLDRTASMRFGTADRRKDDVALGTTIAVGHAASVRGNRVGLVAFGEGPTAPLPPRPGRPGLVGVLLALQDDAGAGAAAIARRRAPRRRRSRPPACARRDRLGLPRCARLEPALLDLAGPPRRARGRGARPARAGAARHRRALAHRPRDGRPPPRRHA